jgi:outer membrane lipoprotein-sorting protein
MNASRHLVPAALLAVALAATPALAAHKHKQARKPTAPVALTSPPADITGATAAPEPAPAAVTDEAARAADLSRISAALNAVTTLTAAFNQLDARGVSSGRFFLERPGRLRFEYDPPARTLVVADGKRVTVRDLKMKTDYRAKIGETPLRLLLKPDVDLAKDANITAIERDGDQLAVTAVETKGYGKGQITLIFKNPGLTLERWIVVDPTGNQTSVTLQDVHSGVALEPSLFELPQESHFESDE